MQEMVIVFFTSFTGLLLMLLPISNPIGMAPNFLFYTEFLSKEGRKRIARKVVIISFFFSIGILILGPLLLRFFGIDISFIKISGGLLLAISGWNILSGGDSTASESSEAHQDHHKKIKTLRDRVFFPIVFPLTVGSGSVAIITAIAANYADSGMPLRIMIPSYLGGILALFVNSLLFDLCYRYSSEIFSRIGKTGTVVICKISALILIAIGLQVTWGGLQGVLIGFFKSLKAANLL